MIQTILAKAFKRKSCRKKRLGILVFTFVTCATIATYLGLTIPEVTGPIFHLSTTQDQRIQKVNFSLTPKELCTESSIVLTIIHSARQNFQARATLRKTIGSVKEFKNWSLPVFFIVGAGSPTEKNTTIMDYLLLRESLEHNDLIQGDFIDTYRNLSYKHVAALQWATEFCPTATFYVKSDDDYLIEMFEMVNLISTIQPNDFNYYCYAATHWKTIRDPKNKIFTTNQEYPGEYYPDFCSGLYIVRMETVTQILRASYQVKYLHLEDVFISGIVREFLNKELFGSSAAQNHNKAQIRIIPNKVASHLEMRTSIINAQILKGKLIEIHAGRYPDDVCELWMNILRVHDFQNSFHDTMMDCDQDD